MQSIEDLGELFLGTRLKRLSDTLYDEVDKIYASLDIQLSSRITSLLFLLHQHGDASITELADALGITHPAVNQMSKKLITWDYVSNKPHPKDDRKRLLTLTKTGQQLIDRLIPIWQELRGCLDEMLSSTEHSLLASISNLEQQNKSATVSERVLARQKLRAADDVTIEPFKPEYANDFKRLNVEWLEKYFYVEQYDNMVLSDPQTHIIDKGGSIYFAIYKGDVIGTVALMKDEQQRVELTKMAVTEKYQGLKVGKKLMLFAIEKFKSSSATLLFLESNKRLTPAITLYEKMGFKHKPSPTSSHYQRADLYMEYEPD